MVPRMLYTKVPRLQGMREPVIRCSPQRANSSCAISVGAYGLLTPTSQLTHSSHLHSYTPLQTEASRFPFLATAKPFHRSHACRQDRPLQSPERCLGIPLATPQRDLRLPHPLHRLPVVAAQSPSHLHILLSSTRCRDAVGIAQAPSQRLLSTPPPYMPSRHRPNIITSRRASRNDIASRRSSQSSHLVITRSCRCATTASANIFVCAPPGHQSLQRRLPQDSRSSAEIQ